ncbi:hypothetical protein INP83_05210 [Mucilaginibacter sp. 21P]|uniref:hypothetical protein n=1 Tax=Mucilaginibacter sp. 21P TaxID=2778902 RepID=UPI001C568C4E|nr:hypothetical protein [Mucilaginibacter sp. 21P]QXV66482.1 hypothetical protein INP83_05210 [Mucilaginibacter sp. 21P]
MNSIEEKLWNYIDGSCPPQEQQAIEKLIATDEIYRRKYDELLQLNNEFMLAEVDEPPMAFTYNVMEAIRTEKAMQPLKARIDGRIIWGIAAFFIITVVAMLAYTLGTVNWSSGASVVKQVELPVQLNANKLNGIFTGPIGKGFLFFYMVMGLFFIDYYLRRRNMTKPQ